MKGYVTYIERATLENNYFRRVLYTAKKYSASPDGPSTERGHWRVNESNTEELKLYTLYSPPEHRDGTP